LQAWLVTHAALPYLYKQFCACVNVFTTPIPFAVSQYEGHQTVMQAEAQLPELLAPPPLLNDKQPPLSSTAPQQYISHMRTFLALWLACVPWVSRLRREQHRQHHQQQEGASWSCPSFYYPVSQSLSPTITRRPHLAPLPQTYVPTFGWYTLIVILVIGYGIIGVEEAAVEVENPFGRDFNGRGRRGGARCRASIGCAGGAGGCLVTRLVTRPPCRPPTTPHQATSYPLIDHPTRTHHTQTSPWMRLWRTPTEPSAHMSGAGGARERLALQPPHCTALCSAAPQADAQP